MPTELTVVILTLNEAPRVSRALRSIPDFGRAVVVDAFSGDGTLESARRAWEESGRAPTEIALVSRPWPGFTRARNESLKWVTTPWVLWLDADEWITPELASELKALLSDPAKARQSVFRIPRLSSFLGRSIRHGGWYPDRKRRLARAAHCEWRPGPRGADVHEDLEPASGYGLGTLAGHLGHEPFRDREEQAATNENYSGLLAVGLAESWKKSGRRLPSDIYIALKGCIKFVENYFWKLGFLDGYPGYLIARGSAASLVMRFRKARALCQET